MSDIDQLILKTIHNRNWRLSHIYSIVDKSGRQLRFRKNIIQRKISRDSAKRKMILKARQFGVSTGCIIEQLDYTLFNKNVTSCILAHEQDSIKKLFRIAKRSYQLLSSELKPVLDRGGGSKYEMYFPEINSRIYCDLESRGDTIQYLHVSEAAFIKDPNKLKSTLQTVPLDGRVTLETTPNGMGNYYYDLWNDPEQNYSKLFFPWFVLPDYKIACDPFIYTKDELDFIEKVKLRHDLDITHEQVAYRRFKQRELKDEFLQEYPEDDQTCFLSSGRPVMDFFVVKERIQNLPPPIEQDDYVKIYKRYVKDRLYVCGADCAEGVGGDYSTGVILDARSREQVATIRGHIKPYDFAHALNDLCLRYHTGGRPYPLLAVERNNHGHAVLLELDDHIRYPNLYRAKDERVGWITDKVTRPIMVDTFIDGVENSTIILNDPDTLSECLTLVSENGKIQAAQGKHDDCVIANAIGVQMCIECGVLDLYDNISEKIRV